ncbi:hypothetical protein [Clostridium perfringens]|uniref:hypothetical protein n=1 Tax=Clostridium perfringens TaxID=1502 RepID=UPI0024BD3CF8|nr:hypothetical protein [Clostridium perfringens]
MDKYMVYYIENCISDGPSLNVFRWCIIIGLIVFLIGLPRYLYYTNKVSHGKPQRALVIVPLGGIAIVIFGFAYLLFTTGYLFPPKLSTVIKENYDVRPTWDCTCDRFYYEDISKENRYAYEHCKRKGLVKDILGIQGNTADIRLPLTRKGDKEPMDCRVALAYDYTHLNPTVGENAPKHLRLKVVHCDASAKLQNSKLNKIYEAPSEVNFLEEVS